MASIIFTISHVHAYCEQIDGVPDVGKFLYRKVHSLHHKSYNPTAFSGTSMHVVEATVNNIMQGVIYYKCDATKNIAIASSSGNTCDVKRSS